MPGNDEARLNQPERSPVQHQARVGVECPMCHHRAFVEIQLDHPVEDYPMAQEIRAQLELWMASHCPNHLRPMLALSKN